MRIYSAHIENQSCMWKKIKIKQLDNNKKDFVVAIHKIEISLNYIIMLSYIVFLKKKNVILYCKWTSLSSKNFHVRFRTWAWNFIRKNI